MRRWVRFNAVGVAGAALQLLTLWFLTRGSGIPYVLATVIAVEIALLHNFVWHERWTWGGCPVEHRRRRFVRFHLANGLVSIASNALFTWVLREFASLPLLISNLLSIGITNVLNFALAHWFVFGTSNHAPAATNASGRIGDPVPPRILSGVAIKRNS